MPLFGSRVSPRCGIAGEMAVVLVEDGRIVSHETFALALTDEDDLLERLLEWHCDVLVCGGIRRELAELLAANEIRVVPNVAGEVDEIIATLCRGTLLPGFGLGHDPAGPISSQTLPSVDCVACGPRSCLSGEHCPLDQAGAVVPPLGRREERIYEVGQDVSAERDPNLCRVAELVHFAVGMGYERIGVAFCWELYREAESLVHVLSRFFTVVPVCCRIGTGDEAGNGSSACHCNPVLQARLLAQAGTDFNVQAGLCLGCDVLFTAESKAPVTTLFVKDRSLSHNPVAAIYTRYHLEDLEREATSHSRSGSGRS
jgi:uncharacterized metal-binding protein/predicted Fe-Mo cluster-binding NifX family protein